MIKKCTEGDRSILNKYLYQRKELNLFIISDIENFGFDSEELEIYMDYDESIQAIYLKFFTNLCLVSYEKKIDLDFIKDMIKKYDLTDVRGEPDLLKLIELKGFKFYKYYFASLNKLSIDVDTCGVSELDLSDIKEYLDKTNLVFNSNTKYESTKAELDKKSKHIFVYKKNNEIVSGVSSSAESKELAMLVGVFTLENYRRKNYALKCVYAICEKLINEGKTVCLFYDNPNAAKMYEKIGFKFIGYYAALKLKKTDAINK